MAAARRPLREALLTRGKAVILWDDCQKTSSAFEQIAALLQVERKPCMQHKASTIRLTE
jgi:hypothetical protein